MYSGRQQRQHCSCKVIFVFAMDSAIAKSINGVPAKFACGVEVIDSSCCRVGTKLCMRCSFATTQLTHVPGHYNADAWKGSEYIYCSAKRRGACVIGVIKDYCVPE